MNNSINVSLVKTQQELRSMGVNHEINTDGSITVFIDKVFCIVDQILGRGIDEVVPFGFKTFWSDDGTHVIIDSDDCEYLGYWRN